MRRVQFRRGEVRAKRRPRQSRDDQSRGRQRAVEHRCSIEPNRFLTGAALTASGFTQLEVLVVLMLILGFIAMLLPAVQNAREAARRMSCRNNLAQISIAIQNYEMAFEVLPPGTVNPTGPIVNQSAKNAYHVSWTVAILPQLELSTVYRRFDFRAGVYDRRNQFPQAQSIDSYTCPSRGGYAACHNGHEAPIDADNDGCFFLNSSIALDEISDGCSHTIGVGENQRVGPVWGWASGTRDTLRNTGVPPNAPSPFPGGMIAVEDFTGHSGSDGWDLMVGPPEDEAARNNPALLVVGGFGSMHSGGAQFAMCDGSIRFISDGIDPAVYQSLGSRNDGAMPENF